MKNVTVSLDDETYRKARRRAAEDERSLSSVVRDFLTTYSALVQPDHAARMQALWDMLDARQPIPGETRRLTREEMYEEALAERGRPRS